MRRRTRRYYGLKIEEEVGDNRTPTHKEQRKEIEDIINRNWNKVNKPTK